MICFYHSADLDGHCSGAIVKHAFSNCELYPINYGDEFPWEKTLGWQSVVMVDFSLQPFEDMLRLQAECKELIWIDHHRTALQDYAKAVPQQDWDGIQREGIGACSLTWEYYFGLREPESVRLLAEYDVWNHTDPQTLPFQYGMRLEETDPATSMEVWEDLFRGGDARQRALSAGKVILAYEKCQNTIYADTCWFPTEFNGHPCMAMNKMLCNSQVFDSVWDPETYAFMLTFGWRKGRWNVSLYTTREDVNVGLIAKGHGGGGHPGAAGFQCQELPFELGGRE